MDQDFSLNADDGIVECHICGKKLSSNASLIDHHRTHTGERPYACGVCSKRFTQKAHLIIHKRTHTGEKPYACSICHKRFAQSSHLKNHKRIHTGEKAYLCSICNMGFSRKPRLEQHLQDHMLHHALLTKSKKKALEKEANKNNSAIKNATKDTDKLKDKIQTDVMSRKRKPSFVTRVHQSDPKLSHFADSNDPDSETGLGDIVIKTEPLEDQHLFSLCDEGSNFHRHRALSTGTLESDANGEDDTNGKQHDSSFLPDWDCKVLIRNQAFSSPKDPSNSCHITSCDQPEYRSIDEGDYASMTNESNNSFQETVTGDTSSEFSLQRGRMKLSSSSGMNKSKSLRNSSGSVRHTSPGTCRDLSRYYRANKSITLIDFSADDLVNHLMARDKVLRCDYCCIIFQDPAMYHLHRSMHDKSDIRCCNTCGKISKDKYDFVAHYLCEHK